MTMPMVEGGRPIAKVRLFGFPVTVDISFLVIVAILGWYGGGAASTFVAWLVVVPLAVLVHELGHAFVARTTGAEPTITLAGLGGLTSYVPTRPLSRARSIAISVAGPAVGIVIGLVLVGYRELVGVPNGLQSDVVELAVWATLWWGLLNLLPILPLDGGQTLRDLLPGTPARRAVRAAGVSVVTAVLAAIAAFYFGFEIAALLAGFFVFSNFLTVKQARELDKVDINQRLVQLLWAGETGAARDLLAEVPTGPQVHPLVRATVRAATDEPDEGRRELESAAALPFSDGMASSLLVLTHRTREDWAGVRAVVARHPGVDPRSVLAAQTVAFRAGAYGASADIGQAWLDHRLAGRVVADSELPGLIAYNVACGWARAGDLDRGVAAFRQAAELGFADLTTLDSDDDIAPLRPVPGYDEARRQVRRRALAAAEESQP